jgi:glycosyltransferase involved in cell wall biosynthesis
MKALHQFVAGFANGDAISNEARLMRKIFRSWGFKSDIFSESRRILPALRKEAHDAEEYAAVSQDEDVVLLHLSTGSRANDIFQSLPCRKAILYHNVTPPHYFELVNKETASNLSRGRTQTKALAKVTDVNMADSNFNADELRQMGYTKVRTLPLLLDFDQQKLRPDRKLLKKFDKSMVNILFVGRCAPNKKIEDLLQAFLYFQKSVNPNSRFIHAGSFAGAERYYYLLLTTVRELGLRNVHFAGSVTQSQLCALYAQADIFLCMSEHEGFCIPIIESMMHGLPVMAYASSAVPETMDGSGILFHEKRFELIAEMIGRVTQDESLASAVISGQHERLARYAGRNLESELKKYLQPLLSPLE